MFLKAKDNYGKELVQQHPLQRIEKNDQRGRHRSCWIGNGSEINILYYGLVTGHIFLPCLLVCHLPADPVIHFPGVVENVVNREQ
jgi:hypothetical protein